MVKGAASFKDHMREGFMEEMEALKAENRRHVDDVKERVDESLQHGFEGFENQMVQMHSQYGKGKHYY